MKPQSPGDIRQQVARLIKDVLESSPFRRELDALARYGANVKQERQIVWLLAKYLDRKRPRRGIVLEQRDHRTDLCVDHVRLEAKYHLEGDLVAIRETWKKQKNAKPFKEWSEKPVAFSPLHEVIRDFNRKDPDLFLWTVACRSRREYKPGSNLVWVEGRYGLEAFYNRWSLEPAQALAEIALPFVGEIERSFDRTLHLPESYTTKGKLKTTYNFFLLAKH